MSTPSDQALIPVSQETTQPVPMEINGADQAVTVPRVQEPSEEAAESERMQMQPGPSSQGQEPAPSAQGPSVVDQRIFVHAPQYHWHQDGGVDREARAAIEKLHKDNHSFARETVRHGDKLRKDVDGLAGVVDQASAALEQQSEFLGELEHQAQSWQEVAQREIGQTRADMVELQGRLTAVESALQDIQGPQWLTWRAELAAMVDKQLEGFESRLQQKMESWTETAISACEAMEDKLENMHNQL